MYRYGANNLSNQVSELERIKKKEWKDEKRKKETVRREEARVEALRVANRFRSANLLLRVLAQLQVLGILPLD